jgi:hypothetical protein
MTNNSDAIPVLIVIAIIFSVAGVLMLFFPRWVRKYDMRLSRFIADEDRYIAAVRMFGIVFLALGILISSGLITAFILSKLH